jgi:hypothetical protein
MKNLFSLLILLLAAGCSSVEEEISPLTQTPVDVYIAGQKNNQACYWKNNQEVLLVNGENTSADTLIVANNVVHILGKEQNNNWFGTYFYWKDNVQTNLTETFGLSGQLLISITGMEVVGNDVYFVGYSRDADPTVEIYDFGYWKNGVKTVLAIVNNRGYKAKIKVVNNDVYVTGNVSNCFDICHGVYKNGVFTPVNSLDVRLTDFAIKNNEVYVYGTNHTQNSAYYKNLTTQNETNVLTINRGHKLVFDLSDTYISDGSNVFKNNTIINSSSVFSFYLDFSALNNNVYILKREGDFGTTDVLYINDVNVFEIFIGDGNFNSITVVQKPI